MLEKKLKVCPKCKFKTRYNRTNIETFFGYRSVSDKGQPVPQSYCRECRNEKEDKAELKPSKNNPKKRKEVKKEMTVGEVVLKKEAEKVSDERKKNIKETYKQMFPQDKSRRGYDYMQARIEKVNGKSA